MRDALIDREQWLRERIKEGEASELVQLQLTVIIAAKAIIESQTRSRY